MSQEPEPSSNETLKHAFIVALLTFAAALVDSLKDSDWVKHYVQETWLRFIVIIVISSLSFAIVFFIGRRLDRNRQLAQKILDRQPVLSAAGPLDGLWVDAVWNGETLVGGSIFSLMSRRSEGFRLNGEFYKLENGVLSESPTGWFNGVGQKIDESGFAYRYEGGEHRSGRPEDHGGTGYYHFHGKPGWQVQAFHGHFSIARSMEVRVVRGERRSINADEEIRTTQSYKWLSEYINQFLSGHPIEPDQ
jgi:hypothetical protein